MRKDDVTILFDYMYWVNHRILDASGRLSSDEFLTATSITTRSLRATLVHELDVEWSWRLNLQGRVSEDDAELDPESYLDVASLAESWQRDDAEARAWLGSLTEQQLATETYPEFTKDRRPLWQFLLHIVTHAAQQQSRRCHALKSHGSFSRGAWLHPLPVRV